jgi:hypothetical protein
MPLLPGRPQQPSRRYRLVLEVEGNSLADLIVALHAGAEKVRDRLRGARGGPWSSIEFDALGTYALGVDVPYADAQVLRAEDAGAEFTEAAYQAAREKYAVDFKDWSHRAMEEIRRKHCGPGNILGGCDS